MNGDHAAERGRAVFTLPHFQQIIVLEPSGRWLGLLRSMLAGTGSGPAPRGKASPIQANDNPARFVVPALDLGDVASMVARLERSLVLVDVPSARVIQTCTSVAAMNWPRSVMLVARSNDVDPRATLLFLESGFAAIIGSVAEAGRLLRLAATHFSGQWPVPRPWPEPVVRQLPWPRHASDVNWAAVLP